jgi:hypothetical protein
VLRDDGFGGPQRLRFRAAGIEGSVDFEAPLVRYEPLGDLPLPFRAALGLVTRPVRRWNRATIALRWSDGERDVATVPAEGVAAVTFLNPTPWRAQLATGDRTN